MPLPENQLNITTNNMTTQLNLEYIEQYVSSVKSYSNRYNCLDSVLYAPENLIGRPGNYPAYGDFPDTYMMRTYGKWSSSSAFYQPDYLPQMNGGVDSEDFVVVEFEVPVIPEKITFFETFNPGAIVRVYGRPQIGFNSWICLYEAETQEEPILRKDAARCFVPPLKKIVELRIEFNHSLLEASTGLDAILLGGFKTHSLITSYLLVTNPDFLKPLQEVPNEAHSVNTAKQVKVITSTNLFNKLPNEIIIKIFQYFDLRTVLRCAQVDKQFNTVASDPINYQNLSLRKYWFALDNNFMDFLRLRCTMLRKLDLSWCGGKCDIDEYLFQEMIAHCCQELTHLALNNCSCVSNAVLAKIGEICVELLDLRLRYCPATDFTPLENCNKLQILDLCGTYIWDYTLGVIFMNNTNLKHLNIDDCRHLANVDELFQKLSIFNRGLITLSCWKVPFASARGVQRLANCCNLRELNMGWLLMNTDTANCLEGIAMGCKELRRLILTRWRNLGDAELRPIIVNCKKIMYLDLLGIRNLTLDFVAYTLSDLPNLQVIDISFCEAIDDEEVDTLKEMYPGVTILRNARNEN